MKPKHPESRKYVASAIFDDLAAFSELELRINRLPTEKERGDAFEVFAEAYLATQKINQAKEIWPETALPPRLIENFNLGRRKGVGVDGVYETYAGDWYAYQVKFRSSRNLSYTEVSPFFGITEAFDQRVLITNCNRLSSQIDDRPNTFCIRGNDLARLNGADFEAIVQWLRSTVVDGERKHPDPHQREALDTILPALAKNNRVSAIMACGTGKTLVTLWAAERHGCKTLLVLVPSLALIRQTLHEWLAETGWSELAYLCVCSDPSVQRGSDNIVVRPSDIDFPVSTDSSNVSAFLLKQFDGVRVIFSTYQSAKVVADGMPDGFVFDLGIFDEAHKTAGKQGKKNNYALDDTNLAIKKRLFVTATPRHYSPTKRTKEGDQALLYSMNDAEVYGPIDDRYELSFAEAARREIICDYKIIVSTISSAEVTNELLKLGEVLIEGDSVRARQVANQLAIKAAIDSYGIKKIFSFHPRVKSAESFTSDRPEGINSIIPDLPAYHVSGAMNTANRDAIMNEFAEQETGIVANAKCLTEGVDVPAVDMVAFMSPKKSKIDIIQATGRAMRRPRGSSHKKYGYVFVPLYIEVAKEETEEEAIKRLGFEELADVLNAMKEQDDILADVIREMREDRGRVGGYDDSRFRERVEVIGKTIQLDVLRNALTTFCVDRLGATWDERFGELLAYKEVYGHCNVPQRYKANPTLATWCSEQRTTRAKGALGDERFKRLAAIGFDFDPLATQWEEMYQALGAFKDEHGHCKVPNRYGPNAKLATWCTKQRVYKKNNTAALTDERYERLVAIGFDFEPNVTLWEAMFHVLEAYRAEHGHCRVPQTYKPNRKFGRWCAVQRVAKAKGTLSEERFERLAAIGFDFDPLITQWEEMYQALVAFKAEHGHCNVPQRYKPNTGLGVWCNSQRTVKVKGALTEERFERLVAIGFDFDPHITRWESMYQALVAYKAEHGHCNVPQSYKLIPKLGSWCNTQRRFRSKGELSDERLARLVAIEFDFDPAATQWGAMYQLLADYKEDHGHCNVPTGYERDPKLATWCSEQRTAKTKSTLSEDRLEQLLAIGFDFDPIASQWEAKYQDLLAFKNEHGHCNVPQSYKPNPKLGSWCAAQRTSKNMGTLSEERVERLVAIDFDFDPLATRWEAMYQALVAFKIEHGHCDVPSRYTPNQKLATWSTRQRTTKAKGALSEEQLERLVAMGFNFAPKATYWEAMYKDLVAFKDEHGHCNVPENYKPNPKLATWCTRQRTTKTNGALSEERLERLVAISFDFDRHAAKWEAMYLALEAFKTEHGHCNVPYSYKLNPKLGLWCGSQRYLKNKGTLSDERLKRLLGIGFDFDPIASQWQAMFQALVAFKDEHGDCNVPGSYKPNPRLAKWCSWQRTNKRKGRLSEERVRRLEAIGFVWKLR